MPWDMVDYPISFKNFSELQKKKTIDIANALVAEGYPDKSAIPIAIHTARNWEKAATSEEIKEFMEKPNPKKTDKHDIKKLNKFLLTADVLVVYDADEHNWKVISQGAKHAAELFTKKVDAVNRAREIAENKESHVVVYNKDGKKAKH